MAYFSGHKPRSIWSYEELFTNLMSDQSERVWNETDTAVLWFPRIFHCIELMAGPSGTLERFDVFCINQMSSWVEGFCVMNIFCLAVLGLIWVLDVICTSLYLTIFPLYMNKRNKINRNCYTFQELSMSKKLFVILLMQNLEPLFWDDVVNNILSTRKKTLPIQTINEQRQYSEYTVEEVREPTYQGINNTRKRNNRQDDVSFEMEEIISLKD